jgi:hypothetical protein
MARYARVRLHPALRTCGPVVLQFIGLELLWMRHVRLRVPYWRERDRSLSHATHKAAVVMG